MDFEAGTHQSRCEGLTGPLLQDVSSDSDSSFEFDAFQEKMWELADGKWVHKDYHDYLKVPKDMAIMLFCHQEPPDEHETWVAIAPEWNNAAGFGESPEDAAEDCQSKLATNKLEAIEDKDVMEIQKNPVRPSEETAKAICKGWVHGRYSKPTKAFFDDLQKRSSAPEMWARIRV